MAHVIVSYDGTRNDRDALAVGRLFARAGATVSLAYVRHSQEHDPQRERLAAAEGERLLAAGAQSLGEGADVAQHVILHPSTSDGLLALASELGADVVAFGSEYRTPAGRVAPGATAERLLDGSSVAVAIAPAGLRKEPIDSSVGTVALADEGNDAAALETAASLAEGLGAALTAGEADVLVIASRADAGEGRLMLGASGRTRLQGASAIVLAMPRAVTVGFGAARTGVAAGKPGVAPGGG